MRGVCTVKEYDLHWSLYDLLDANEALDVTDEHEDWSQAEAERRAKARARQG